MTSFSLCRVIALNQNGIQCLSLKHLKGAFAAFYSAVSHMKELQERASAHSIAPWCKQISLSFPTFAETRSSKSFSNQEPFVFEAPVQVVAESVDSSDETNAAGHSLTQVLHKLSFALVFNLAICFHLGAIRNQGAHSFTSHTTELYLLKALSFYDLSQDILQKVSLAPGIAECLAISNNKANIFLLLHQPTEARQCLDHLQCNVMQVVHQRLQHAVPNFGDFLFSALFKPTPTATAA